jgi:DNA-binding transcriptional LysR family regulator
LPGAAVADCECQSQQVRAPSIGPRFGQGLLSAEVVAGYQINWASMTKKPPNWQTFQRRLDWNLLKIFDQIAESEGVSNAAKVMLRKQPAVSASLRQLEDALQAKLCERGPSGFRLTAEGEKLYELTGEIVRLIRTAPDDINKILGELTGTLKVCMISNVFLPKLDMCFERFARENPLIRLNISIYPWEVAANLVLNSEADIAVIYQRVPKAELHYQWLCRETQHLYCGRGHPLYGTKISDPIVLGNEPFILTGLDEAEEVASFRLRYRLGNKVKAVSEDLSEVRRMINCGIGIGFLPMANAGQDEQTLWSLFDENVELPSYNLWVVSPKPHKRSPIAERFVSTVIEVLQDVKKEKARAKAVASQL